MHITRSKNEGELSRHSNASLTDETSHQAQLSITLKPVMLVSWSLFRLQSSPKALSTSVSLM